MLIRASDYSNNVLGFGQSVLSSSTYAVFCYTTVRPCALPDYEGLDTHDPNCVVLADATDVFSYDSLNDAFRLLMDQQSKGCGTLISLGKG